MTKGQGQGSKSAGRIIGMADMDGSSMGQGWLVQRWSD